MRFVVNMDGGSGNGVGIKMSCGIKIYHRQIVYRGMDIDDICL